MGLEGADAGSEHFRNVISKTGVSAQINPEY